MTNRKNKNKLSQSSTDSRFAIQTPIGRGTVVGTSQDRKRILVMHTRFKDEASGKKNTTYARWWDYDPQKGEIVERDTASSSDTAENTE